VAQRNDTKARRSARVPIWNEHALDCPTCSRHFEPFTIRILKHAGAWHCHRCVNTLTARAARIDGPKVVSDTQGLATQLCHTCAKPFGPRRIVTNVNGALVHYRCPKKRSVRPAK
jgi:hypothetical protein